MFLRHKDTKKEGEDVLIKNLVFQTFVAYKVGGVGRGDCTEEKRSTTLLYYLVLQCQS